jgi:hypothetical protein
VHPQELRSPISRGLRDFICRPREYAAMLSKRLRLDWGAGTPRRLTALKTQEPRGIGVPVLIAYDSTIEFEGS